MGFARIDDALELGIGQQPIAHDTGRQARSIVGLGRRDGRHRRRLHEPRRMRPRADDPDRLQLVSFIQRVGEAAALDGLPVDGLVGEFGARSVERTARNGARLSCRPTARSDRDGMAGCGKRCRAMNRQARWNMRCHPLEQRGDVGRHAGDAGNDLGSSAGTRSMTVRRVSTWCRDGHRHDPSMAAENTTRPRSWRRTKASRHDGWSGRDWRR